MLKKRALFERITALVFGACLFCTSALAAPVAEAPGDGLDDAFMTGGSQIAPIGSCPVGYMDSIYGPFGVGPVGCDRKCQVPDEDCDGYTSNGTLGSAGTTFTDSNDHDRREIPLDYYPCNAGGGANSGYHLAQSNGTYGLCISNNVTPLCEATGGGQCKYVNCAGAAGVGTYVSPYNTIAAAAAVPTGSYVYLLAGTCTAGASFANSGVTVENYPGGTAVINVADTNGLTFLDNSTVIAVTMTGDCTNGASNSTLIFQGTHNGMEVRRSVFQNWAGNSFNNNSMIYLNTTNTSNLHHNFFNNWKQGSGTCHNPGQGGNANAIKWLDNASSGFGANHGAHFNVFLQATPQTSDDGGGAVFFKHGILSADAGTGTFIDHNYFINLGTAALVWTSSKLRYHHNFNLGSGNVYAPTDASPAQEDNQFYFNTVVGDISLGNWVFDYGSPTEKLIWHDNIFYDTHTSYNHGNHEGVVQIDAYGSDAHEAQVRSNNGGTGSLFGDHNCYFNPNIPLNFCYFCESNAGGGPAGGDYTFTEWKTLTGPITSPPGPQQTDVVGSVVEDPLFDPLWQSASVNCASRGAFISSGAPTPTPTPTPTVGPGIANGGSKFLKVRK